MRSISSTVTVSARPVFGDACPAICWAYWVPSFDRYAVIPVARNVWQQVDGGSPAATARRLIMASTTRRVNGPPRQPLPRPVHALKQRHPAAPRTRRPSRYFIKGLGGPVVGTSCRFPPFS